jgi:hypothetical protein
MKLLPSLIMGALLLLSKHPQSDVNLDEIGGCTGGPIIIDFEKRTIEVC